MCHHRETIKSINVSDKDPKFQHSVRDCDEKSAPSEVKKIPNAKAGLRISCSHTSKKASEYDQEIPQSHTADQPTIPWGRAT